MEEEQQNQDARDRARIRGQFRSITGTTFILVIIFLVAVWANIVKPPFMYVLFSLIFVVDFSLHMYVIWKQKIYWWSSRKYVTGGVARLIAVVYGFLALVCLTFAIFSLTS